MRIASHFVDIGLRRNVLVNNYVQSKMQSFRFLYGTIESIMARSAMLISTTGSTVSSPDETTEGTWGALSDDRL